MNSAVPTLFTSPEECCGCGACAARCPFQAIEMREDVFGFVYPHIDEEICMGCGLCKRVCGYQGEIPRRSSGPWYAASAGDGSPGSASGGAFAMLAQGILENGGVVYGAAYERMEDGLHVRHRRIQDLSELVALQGSKYVQSRLVDCFPEVEEDLKRGVPVLFSGTPCQIAGVKSYLKRDYANLLTVDLICHGVPNEVMFIGYVKMLERQAGSRIADMRFRDKARGWDAPLALLSKYENGSTSLVPAGDSSYYDSFLHLKTLRDSCYSCPFAGKNRPADLTVGDYWGVQVQTPELLSENGGPFEMRQGISCLLVNNRAGQNGLEKYGVALKLRSVDFGQIAAGNDQLRAPAVKPKDRKRYLLAFSRGGWPAVEREWRVRKFPSRIKSRAFAYVPRQVKDLVKKFLGR